MFITESGFNSTTLSKRFEALVFNTSTQVVVPSGTPPAAVFTKCHCSIKKTYAMLWTARFEKQPRFAYVSITFS